jgi:hypothetical protein
VLAAAHKWRSLVVPPVSPAELAEAEPAHEQPQRRATHRCHWPWARLLKRSLGVDGDKCDACGAPMKLRALVIAARSIERLRSPRRAHRAAAIVTRSRPALLQESRGASKGAPPDQLDLFGA